MNRSARSGVTTPLRAILLVILIAAACGTDRTIELDGGATVRDSAGIGVIANPAAERQLSTREVLRVGVIEGDPNYLFSRIRALALDGRGGFWVVDSHSSIRHYDSAGVYLGRVGAAGRGPGEAQSYAGVWVAGDRVLAWGNPSTLQLFTPAGQLLRSQAAASAGRVLIPIGFARDQWYFALNQYRTDDVDVFRRTVHLVAARDPAGGADTIRSFPGELMMRARGNEFSRASYFFGNPAYAIDSAGRLFLSDTVQYRIATYDPRGRLIRIVHRQAAPRRFDDGWLSEIEEAVTAALRGDHNRPVDPAERNRIVSTIIPKPTPEQLPVIRRLLVAPGGEFWVERGDLHAKPALRAVAHGFGYVRHAWRPEWSAPVDFDVFTARGTYRGSVQLPPNVEPMAITADRLYGVLYDELGVEFIVALEVAGGDRN